MAFTNVYDIGIVFHRTAVDFLCNSGHTYEGAIWLEDVVTKSG
jgi:hypothetical protein